jgi:Helix-turn-helix domain
MGTLLETAEVARLAGLCPDTVRAAARRGEIVAAVVTGRGGRLFDRETALAWASSRRPHPLDGQKERGPRAESTRTARLGQGLDGKKGTTRG